MRSPGKVYLVGAGPGDPELLTLKAARLLASAEIVLHDDLVPPAVLALANPRALTVNVGKRCGAKKITQAEINQLMIDKASQGVSIVRLKSGDPLVFGRAGEEIDALREAGIPYRGCSRNYRSFCCCGFAPVLTNRPARLIEYRFQFGPPRDWRRTRNFRADAHCLYARSGFFRVSRGVGGCRPAVQSALCRHLTGGAAGPTDHGDHPGQPSVNRSGSGAGAAAGWMGVQGCAGRCAGLPAVPRQRPRVRRDARSLNARQNACSRL